MSAAPMTAVGRSGRRQRPSSPAQHRAGPARRPRELGAVVWPRRGRGAANSSAAAAAKDQWGGGGETRLTAVHAAGEGGGEPSCTCHGMGEGWVSVGGLAAALRSG